MRTFWDVIKLFSFIQMKTLCYNTSLPLWTPHHRHDLLVLVDLLVGLRLPPPLPMHQHFTQHLLSAGLHRALRL